MIISLIAAVSENNVIGSDSDLPWKLPRDMKYFMDSTMGHHILMGRKTYESFPKNLQPLPGRTNIVITRNNDYKSNGAVIFNDLFEGIKFAESQGEEELFVIGGGTVYEKSLDMANRLYITRVHHEFEGDTFFPEINHDEWTLVKEDKHKADDKNPYDFTFLIYLRK